MFNPPLEGPKKLHEKSSALGFQRPDFVIFFSLSLKLYLASFSLNLQNFTNKTMQNFLYVIHFLYFCVYLNFVVVYFVCVPFYEKFKFLTCNPAPAMMKDQTTEYFDFITPTPTPEYWSRYASRYSMYINI